MHQTYIKYSTETPPKYPQTFTGKERDSETGYSYFGARFYDSDLMTGWLSVDPMADKYPNLSPYAYCGWNPVKLVDPDGKQPWKPDEDGNLLAEKGDNAWTLAEYLNTTPLIAYNMLKEQGYFNSTILNLNEGDVFKVDNGMISHNSNVDLGMVGNFIKNNAGSGIAEDLFVNYWNKDGDISLTSSQFAGILLYIKENNPSSTQIKENSKVVSFYDSPVYSRAYGSATITTDKENRIIGFHDDYNFDPKEFGIRSLKNEVITRGVNTASKITGNGKDFEINYP